MVVDVLRLDNFGRGIGYIDNKICFIYDALPDEKVEVEIVYTNSRFNECRVKKYLKKSKERVKPLCPYYSKCGGCCFQNISFDYENDYKLDKVRNLVKRIGHCDPSIVLNINNYSEFNYRNKVVFHVKDRKLGFYNDKSNELVKIENCLLLRDEINSVIPIITKVIEDQNNDIVEVMVRVSNDNSDLMISLSGSVVNFDLLKESFKCIYINDELVYGKKLISNIGNYKFYLSPKSFFQVNSEVVTKLYDSVLDYCINNKPKSVLDLYCGTGSIGIYVSKYCDSVFGIDSSESSINDAKENINLNNINNVEVVCSKVEDYIDKLVGNYDLIIVDPPRIGLDKKTIEYLNKINSNTIIYISCDPTTMSRDLNLLSDLYNISYVRPFNMFPKTYHCESVCILERR